MAGWATALGGAVAAGTLSLTSWDRAAGRGAPLSLPPPGPLALLCMVMLATPIVWWIAAPLARADV
jgi:hypothetical protein